MKKQLFAAGFACATLSSVNAAVSGDDPIIITATRTVQTADESLASVTVIAREAIESSQAKDVAELLRFHAGIDIGRNGGLGQLTSVFMRGTDSNHVLVLLDGVKINPGNIGGVGWQNLNPEHIERIEIVRGPRSSLYGSDAIGGVVQLFTRRAGPGTQMDVMAGASRYASREASFGASHDTGAWRGGVRLSGIDSEGFPARAGAADKSGFRNASAHAYAGTRLGGIDAEISHWQTRGNTEYLDFSLKPLDQDFQNSVTAMTIKYSPAARWASTLRLNQMRDDIEQNQSADFAHTRRNVVDWQHDIQTGRNNLLSVGLYAAREHTDALSFGTGYDVDTDTDAVYVQNQWQSGAHRVTAAWRYTDHQTFGGHHTGDLGYGLQVTPKLRLNASLSSGFRAPDSADRFGFGGNPDLKPETSRNIELGARLQLTPDQTLRMAVFQNDIDDLINFVDPDGFAGPLPGKNQNIDRARIRGLELGYLRVARPWRFTVEASAQNPENRATGRQLARRAAHSLTFGASYSKGALSTGMDLLATGRRTDSDFNDERLAGYALLNLFGDYRLNKQWSLRARLENVFNQRYELAAGYNNTGRALFVQLHYHSGMVGSTP